MSEDEMEDQVDEEVEDEAVETAGRKSESPQKSSPKKTTKEVWLAQDGLDDNLYNFPGIGSKSLEKLKESEITRAGQLIGAYFGECECDVDKLTSWMASMGVSKAHAGAAAAAVGAKYPKADAKTLAAATRTSKKTTIEQWVQSDGLLDDIKLMPGVGPVGLENLKKNQLTRAGQMIEAWFETCKMDEELFANWLKENGVAASSAKQCAHAISEKFPKLKTNSSV